MIPIRKPLRRWNSQNLSFLQAISWQRWKRKMQPVPKAATRNTGLVSIAESISYRMIPIRKPLRQWNFRKRLLLLWNTKTQPLVVHQNRMEQNPAIPATAIVRIAIRLWKKAILTGSKITWPGNCMRMEHWISAVRVQWKIMAILIIEVLYSGIQMLPALWSKRVWPASEIMHFMIVLV